MVVATVSRQSVASLAAYHGTDCATAYLKIAALLRALGVRHVLDAAAARELSLVESAHEFVRRYRAAEQSAGPRSPSLPILASSCPGWVCYAEKQHGDYVLPYISTVKSPQAVMGTFVKSFLARGAGYNPANLCHLAIMPCYDKVRYRPRDGCFVSPCACVGPAEDS